MDSNTSFLLGGALVSVIVVIAWLSSNLMMAQRVIMSVDKQTKDVKDCRLVEQATYPYINTHMGLGYGYPLQLLRASAVSYPYYVTV